MCNFGFRSPLGQAKVSRDVTVALVLATIYLTQHLGHQYDKPLLHSTGDASHGD